MGRRTRRALVATGTGLVVTGAFVAGRLTAPHPVGGRAGGDGYVAGVRAGEARGLREGRALQEGAALPPDARQPVQDAFDAGYAAGANDVFSGYDGGWTPGACYAITLAGGEGAITYRIASRAEVRDGGCAP